MVAVMIKLSRSYDLEMIINVSEQYILLLCICYKEGWFLAFVFLFVQDMSWEIGSRDHVALGE
jgi:hypothetical protein